MSASRFAAALSLVMALLVAGCSGVVDPSKNTIETFSATLAVGQSVQHNFNVGKNGELSVRLTAISPNPASLLGTYLGQPFAGGCSLFSGPNNFTGLNRDTFNGPINKGTYCLVVFDTGSLTTAQNYTIQISHP